MQAYSLDLRQRVVRAYEQGHGSIAEIAEQFSVSPGFVKKMLRQWRSTGDLSPLPHGGGKPASLPEALRQKLRRKVREQDDISLAELQDFLREEEQASVHVSTISRALKSWACRVKKVPAAGERNNYKRGWYWRRVGRLTSGGCASSTRPASTWR